MMQQELAEAERNKSAEQQVMESALAAHIRKAWETNKNHKRPIEEVMLSCLRMRNGEYGPKTLAEIRKQGGSEIYMMLVATKCRALKSWLTDIFLPAKGEVWGIDPTTEPELPPEMMEKIVFLLQREIQVAQAHGVNPAQEQIQARQEEVFAEIKHRVREAAKQAAKQMENRIVDQLEEGRFREAFEEFIDDFVTFPAAFIKGPIMRRRPSLKFVGGRPVVEHRIIEEDERISPFDAYPSPGAKTCEDGDFCEHVRYSRSDLYGMIGVPGYDEQAIRQVLYEYGAGGLRHWLWTDQEREGLENRKRTSSDSLIDGIHFWGSVSGLMLLEWGVPDEQIEDPLKEYECEAILVGRHLIRVELNRDPLLRRPYQKASFQKKPGSFWGISPPQLMKDIDRLCNATARSLSNNLGISSGPQVVVLADRLADGADVTTLYPWKIHQMTSDVMGNSNAKPVEFFQPQSNAGELLAVYNNFEQKADDATGIPRYTYGNEKVGGAGETAQGLSMLMDSAAKGIKDAARHIDAGIFRPRIEKQFFYNMLRNPEMAIVGDMKIVARGTSAQLAKGQEQQRRNEFLQITSNPIDLQIMGIEGRAELLRPMAEDLGVDASKVIPKGDVLRQKLQQQSQPQEQGDGKEVDLAIHRENLQDKERDRQLRLQEKEIDAGIEQTKGANRLHEIVLKNQGDRQLIADEARVKSIFGSGV